MLTRTVKSFNSQTRAQKSWNTNKHGLSQTWFKESCVSLTLKRPTVTVIFAAMKLFLTNEPTSRKLCDG